MEDDKGDSMSTFYLLSSISLGGREGYIGSNIVINTALNVWMIIIYHLAFNLGNKYY